jgi:hypothetical protein
VKIGILSDTHNNAENTQVALSTFRERGVEKLIHCGDIATPGIVRLFMGWDVTFVFGNMDRDQSALVEAAKSVGLRVPQQTQIVEVPGTSIAVTHGDHASELFRLTVSRKHAYVCHGHTHERLNEVKNSYGVRVINPGALGGNKPQTRSVAILDTDSGEVEFIEFPTL